MKNNITIIFFIALTTVMFSCSDDAHIGQEETEQITGHVPESEVYATLTQEQIKMIGIELGSIEQKQLSNSIKANGILKVPNQNKAFVTPFVTGVVRRIFVQTGSHVKAGQAIATVYNPEFTDLQQQLQQLKIEISLSEKEVARQKELVEGNAAPLKRLQQAESELATLESRRDGIRKLLAGMGVSEKASSDVIIKAPITGTVSQLMAQIGSNVDMTTPIAEIVNNTQLHVDLFIYERELPHIRTNQLIHFTITNNPGREYDATIFSVGSAFEGDSKTVPVHADIKGDKTGLIDGMSITALISLNEITSPAVPTEAIVSEGGKDYIFIVSSSGANDNQATATTFKKILVAKGITDVGYSEITPLQEIPQNAQVVTRGAFFILGKMTNTGEHAD